MSELKNAELINELVEVTNEPEKTEQFISRFKGEHKDA